MTIAERLEKRLEACKAEVLERGEGHYEVQEVSFGKVYRWCPEYVIVECGCGARSMLTRSATTCECSADHSGFFREVSPIVRLEDEGLHPWRSAEDHEDAGLPC